MVMKGQGREERIPGSGGEEGPLDFILPPRRLKEDSTIEQCGAGAD